MIKKQNIPRSSFKAEKFCIETFNGLEELCIQEIQKITSGNVNIVATKPGLIYFQTKFNLAKLYELKIPVNIYLVVEVTGNKLSNEENIRRVISGIRRISAENEILYGQKVFNTFKLSTRGANSEGFEILKDSIIKQTSLDLVLKGGDMVIKRVVYTPDLLLRISPRPLSTVFWRVANFNAALNASIANAMIFLTNPRSTDRILNICAGSGTLFIERCLYEPFPAQAFGVEIESSTIDRAKRNIKESQISNRYVFLQGDARSLSEIKSLSNVHFDVILGDLPYGLNTGRRSRNSTLYNDLLLESLKVADPKVRICLITQDVNTLNHVIESIPELHIEKTFQIKVSTNKPGMYIYPVIYLIKRKAV